MIIIENLKYSNDHEWVRVEGNKAYIGISDYAQHNLGDIVFIELPEAGDVLKKEAIFGVTESVKAASDIFLPVSGTVLEVNEEVINCPSLVNQDAYTNWMICIDMSNPDELNNLMDASEYRKFCGE